MTVRATTRADRLGRPRRPACGHRTAPAGGGRRHVARLAVHRTARVGPVQRRDRLRRGAAVRAGRVRRVPLVPRDRGRLAPRRPGHPHREALHRRRRGARPGPQLGAGAGRQPLAGDGRGGRRPAHRPGRQRPPQGDRGADRAHGVAAVRADGRGRPADDPVPHPAGRARHALRRGRHRLPRAHRGARRRDRVVRRPRQPGPHRSRPGAGSRRGHPAPSPRGGRHPGAADLAGRVHVRGRGPARPRQGGGRGAHHRARRAREGRSRPRLRCGRARPPPAGVRPGPPRHGEVAEDAGQATPPRRGRPRADGPDLGLPRRAHPPARRAAPSWSTRSCAATWWRWPTRPRRSRAWRGSRRCSRRASRCWSSTSPRCWRWSR